MKPRNVSLFISLIASVAALAQLPQYPITREYHSNPMFTEFPSPMYHTDSIGRLFTADASAHVWADGRLYLYASHDMEPAQGCDRMDRYHVFSTDDMVNWTDHGEIVNSDDVKRTLGWGIEGWMWAPDCAYNPADQTYYFYFPHVNEPLPWGGHDWRIGVATSKDPAKGFTPIGYVKGAASLIDPCVFVDDDGTAYFYNGGGGRCMGGKLCADDWTQVDGEMIPMEGLEDFHEATWIHKFNGKYYLSHSDGHGDDGNQMRYAVSDSPLGPWKELGVYLYGTGCGTDHGSIVNYKGQWYAVYHNCTESDREEQRSVCIDKLTINPDGTIEPVHNWGEPFGDSDLILSRSETVVIPATNFNRGGETMAYHKRGRKGEPVVKDGYIADMTEKEWLRYSVKPSGKKRYNVSLRVRPLTDNVKVHLSANGTSLTGHTDVYNTGDWTDLKFLGLEIPADARYLDFRVDNGTIDFESITIQPNK